MGSFRFHLALGSFRLVFPPFFFDRGGNGRKMSSTSRASRVRLVFPAFRLILITFIYENGRTYNFRSPAPTAPLNYVKKKHKNKKKSTEEKSNYQKK